MRGLSARLDDELRVSPRPVILALVALGQVLVFVADGQAQYATQFTLQCFALTCMGLAGVTWLLTAWRVHVGRWITIGVLVVLILGGYRWLNVPGLLGLLSLPAALAAALLNLPAAAAVACGETALLVLLPGYIVPGANWAAIGVALIAIWGMVGVMVAAYLPIHQLSGWLEIYMEQARDVMEEARNRKAELAQTKADWLNACRQITLANEHLVSLRLIAEEAKRSKAAFVARVSHEFRTPLNIITGLINILIEAPEVYDGDFPPKALKHMHIVYRNCQHLASMIDDVLDLTQVEAGRMALQREWIDLVEVVYSASDVIRSLVSEKGLALQITVPGDFPDVYCDRIRIRQVILNLLSNAARLTSDGGITVNLSRHNQHILVSVTDTGPGISTQDAEKIFEPFSKASSQLWHSKGGSGLGLSISKQFVQLHGGRMWLESTLDVGTTFFIELPISGSQEHRTKPNWRMKEDWIWHERSFRSDGAGLADQVFKPRVVVCDETGEIYSAFTRYSHEMSYVDARSLPEALVELESYPTRAVVINAVSPKELWPMIDRSRQVAPDTPILGFCCPPKELHALEAGAVGYLTKPVTCAELNEMIGKVNQPIERILIVDDEADVRELLTLFLHMYDDSIQVTAVESGEQALQVMRVSRPDLMILDVLMPGMDGWQLLAIKNEDITLRDIPVLLISAQDPREGPITSTMLVATIGEGLSLSKLLDCSRDLTTRLLAPD